MRPFVVELLLESIKLGLLLEEVGRGGSGGLLLQGQMHALMAAILLGMARADALDGDTEAQPPDREPGELKQAVRGSERDAVVGADRQGQTPFPEKAFEGGERQIFPRGLQRLAQQQ